MASNAELTLILKARNLASREVDRLHGSLIRAKGGAKNLLGGLTTLAKIGIAGVAIAAGALVAGLIEATRRAADEQKGISRLDAALRTNIKGYQGNSKAIEDVISKREKLGFSDDEQRDSLSVLVTKYHNVAKAQKIQSVAMDVARLKNISLKDATALVSKGMDGSAKVLKQLGIELPKTATEHERLAAIQKKVAGQAEAYGKTAAGAQQAFQIALDDVVEDIGAGLLPIMTQAFNFLTNVGIPAIRGIIGSIQKWMAENKPLIDQIKNVLGKVIGIVAGRIRDVVGWIKKMIDQITANKPLMKAFSDAFKLIGDLASTLWKALEKVAEWIAQVFNTITSNKAVMGAFRTAFDVIGGTVRGLADAFRQLVEWVGKAIDSLSHLKLPDVTGITNWIPHWDKGGMVNAPQGAPVLGVVHGGERVLTPAQQRQGGGGGGGGGGFTIAGVSEREILAMVDRGLYFKLQRSAPTLGRT